MMICIKGMDMPNHCMECELAIEDNDYDKHCPFTKVECLNIARQVNCPLIEVPKPHGRLIDADALVECAEQYELEGGTFCIDSVEDLYAWLYDNAPTVIEGTE